MTDAQTVVQVKQALALLYATNTDGATRKQADTWLQAFITAGYGACLAPCALILDDAAAQPHEALFAATATHQTLRKCQFRSTATQRSHVVMSAEGAAEWRQRIALRCGTAPPGPLQTRYALTLAAALLKSDQSDLVALVAAALAGASLAETLKALPEELEGLSMHPNLRDQRRRELDDGAPTALHAILTHAQSCGAQRAFAAAAAYVSRLHQWRAVPAAVSLVASAREAMLSADGEILESAATLLSAAVAVSKADDLLADELLPLAATWLGGRRGDLCAAALAEACASATADGAARLAAALCAAVHDTCSQDVAAAAALACERASTPSSAPADFVRFACRRASFQTARDPFEANEDEAQACNEDDIEREILADGVRACSNTSPEAVLQACRDNVAAYPAGVLSVARAVLLLSASPLRAPLAELGLGPVVQAVASVVDAQTGVCCGLFLQAVASSKLRPLAAFAEASARLAAARHPTARRHGFVALMRLLDADPTSSSEAAWRVAEHIVSSDIGEPPLRAGREPVLALACRCLARMAHGTDRVQPLLVSCVQRAEACDALDPCKFAAAHLALACVVATARPLLLNDLSAATRVAGVAGAGVLRTAQAYPAALDEDVADPARAADAACAVLAALVAPNWKDDAPKKRDGQATSAEACRGVLHEEVLHAAFEPALLGLQVSSGAFRAASAPAALRFLELVVSAAPDRCFAGLSSSVVGALQEVARGQMVLCAPALRGAVGVALRVCLRLMRGKCGHVERCALLLCQVQLTRPTASEWSEDMATEDISATLKVSATLFATALRQNSLSLVLRAQRDGVLPSACVVEVARLVRTRYPVVFLAADVRVALELVTTEKKGPHGGVDAAADLAAAAKDEKKFKKLLKAMVGGKRKGGGS